MLATRLVNRLTQLLAPPDHDRSRSILNYYQLQLVSNLSFI